MTDFKNIKAFAFDVDGVATEGGVFCNEEGQLLRTYDAKDGFAIRMARMNGYPVAVITGGASVSILKRFRTSGIADEDVFLHSRNKMDDFRRFCDRHGLEARDVMYFGDDVPDLEVMSAAGIGVAPADAVDDVLAAADYVSPKPGGRGCLREAIEKTLKIQGKWTFDAPLYKQLF